MKNQYIFSLSFQNLKESTHAGFEEERYTKRLSLLKIFFQQKEKNYNSCDKLFWSAGVTT